VEFSGIQIPEKAHDEYDNAVPMNTGDREEIRIASIVN
jgi:hypothetical protein